VGNPATNKRDLVWQIARSDQTRALKLAGDIEDPWFRCQALAHVAHHVENDTLRKQLLSKAFHSAKRCGEPNRIVTASSWPLKVLCLSGAVGELRRQTGLLLKCIEQEGSPVRRLDALHFVLGAVAQGPNDLFGEVFEKFQASCLQPLHGGKRNKRGEARLVDVIPLLMRLSPARAKEASDKIAGPDNRATAERLLRNTKQLPLEKLCWWGPNLG